MSCRPRSVFVGGCFFDPQSCCVVGGKSKNKKNEGDATASPHHRREPQHIAVKRSMATLILLAALSAHPDPGKATSESNPNKSPHEKRCAMMQERRDKEALRRQCSRALIPKPREYTDEQRAKGRLDLLPRIVNPNTAARWAQLIVKEFPETPSGQKAQEWLWDAGR